MAFSNASTGCEGTEPVRKCGGDTTLTVNRPVLSIDLVGGGIAPCMVALLRARPRGVAWRWACLFRVGVVLGSSFRSLLGFAACGGLNDCRGADAMRTTDAKQRKGQRASRLPCLPRREIGHGGLPTTGLFGDLRLRHPLIGDRFDVHCRIGSSEICCKCKP